LQERRFAEAIGPLAALAADPKLAPNDRAAIGLVLGGSLRSAGRLDEAKAALRAAIGADPEGPWGSKLRFELAAAEFASRRFVEAELLARDEVARLLAPGRKDRLAEVYRTLADALLNPPGWRRSPTPRGPTPCSGRPGGSPGETPPAPSSSSTSPGPAGEGG
jgi:tetratricopeptide (TPR) repeat protein